jgi:hypothetical protein
VILFFIMARENPEWLNRDEPVRVPVEDILFKENLSRRELLDIERTGAKCLAKELANANGFNSASDVTVGATSYGEERVLEDGSKEQLLGCRGCGAMCTIVRSARKQDACPGTEDNPNVVISVAEAPQPNPWAELGTFADCKAGEVTVPNEASSLTQPHGLTDTQRMIFKIMSGRLD